ncbi:unnamed protein product [Euphydryas editha]|uniref:Ig-like domain-containing protein n=1 Tax=Euphydryas editha TaxID=104508 RepID=A0AAU9TLK6_EUPED|nr:unnamed protein product [Euphydryas editha]
MPTSTIPAGPEFEAAQQTMVLARVGETAALRCRVLRLADRAVSWVRSSDLQILTHAGAVFTADARVSCSEAPADAHDVLTSRDDAAAGAVHTLRIERLRASDAGRYECQVNTEPKMSLFFNLTVVAESAMPVLSVRAVGTEGGVVRGARGGAAQLACEARYEPAPGAPALAPDVLAAMPPLRIRWMHDGETLDPQSARGGISLDAERWAGRALSRLTLAALRARDAGRYTCAAGERSAALLLRLRDDDERDYELIESEMETMQRDAAVARVSSSGARASAVGLLLSLLSLLLLLLPLFLT